MLHAETKTTMPPPTPLRLLLASLLVAVAFSFTASAEAHAAPSNKNLKRADNIVAELRRLEDVSATASDFGTYRAEVKRAYPRLFVEASEVDESDLKTHLTTAVFLYEDAYRDWFVLKRRAADCGAELRESYRRLCRTNEGGDALRLLLSKASLHTAYAEALVWACRGMKDASALASLAELESEREADLVLAEGAVAALQALGARVKVQLPPTQPGEGGRDISFAQFIGEAYASLASVDRLLASMPRSPLRSLLRNAADSFRDGVYWWRMVGRREELTVSAEALIARDPLKTVGLEADGVKKVALSNWLNALKYTDRAAATLNDESGRTRDLAQNAASEF